MIQITIVRTEYTVMLQFQRNRIIGVFRRIKVELRQSDILLMTSRTCSDRKAMIVGYAHASTTDQNLDVSIGVEL